MRKPHPLWFLATLVRVRVRPWCCMHGRIANSHMHFRARHSPVRGRAGLGAGGRGPEGRMVFPGAAGAGSINPHPHPRALALLCKAGPECQKQPTRPAGLRITRKPEAKPALQFVFGWALHLLSVIFILCSAAEAAWT